MQSLFYRFNQNKLVHNKLQILGKNPATVSKWCTNVSQPDLYTLDKIAILLDIDKRELIKGKD